MAAVQPRERTLNRGLRGGVAGVFHPDFAGDEDIVARHAAFPHAAPYFGFVQVGLRGVDVAVACGKRGGNCGLGVGRRDLENAETEGGDFYAVG